MNTISVVAPLGAPANAAADGAAAVIAAQTALLEAVRRNDPSDLPLIEDACRFAIAKHGPQIRASGEPYVTHPMAVARVLAGMRLDRATIATAVLHDTVEDTEATPVELSERFGEEIARLVDGVTKLSRIEQQHPDARQAENFRKLIVAMSTDIRVIIVKLADRLHNLETLAFVESPDKRRRIARETLDIYAPLAARLGINRFKDDLEDLAFRELNPDGHASILSRLAYLRADGDDLISGIVGDLERLFSGHSLNVRIDGREKRPYSIWRKMEKKQVSFEQLSDVMAFRVLVDAPNDCYVALGVVHGAYSVVPDRFKDYISTPKANGYRSLHTTVIGPRNRRIEIQIRTQQMHREAEWGVAAHWAYKTGEGDTDGRRFRWVRELIELVEDAQRPEEMLENTRLELYQDEVFCFTPKGDIVALPSGATPIDFAYAVHSEVGNKVVGAKVNGRLVPVNSVLVNGDQVEILTSRAQTPSPNWERFVVTGKARAAIRRFIRLRQRDEYAKLGRAMLEKQFRQEGYDFAEKAVHGVLKKLQIEEIDDLYAAVGAEERTAREVFTLVYPDHRPTVPGTPLPRFGKRARKPSDKDTPFPLKGLIPGLVVHSAGCCNPIPGDRIVGIVTTGKGVTIHTIDCETLEHFHDSPERWLDVAWDLEDASSEMFNGRLHTVISNEPGSLGVLSTVIGRSGGNITNLKIVSRSEDFWDMLIDINVRDRKHLTGIVAALRATPEIVSVDRAREH